MIFFSILRKYYCTGKQDFDDGVGKIERYFLWQRYTIIDTARVIKIFAYSQDINAHRGVYIRCAQARA